VCPYVWPIVCLLTTDSALRCAHGVFRIMIELGPATSKLAALVDGVRDDQLALPTVCDDTDVAALLHHIGDMSLMSINAATKANAQAVSESDSEPPRLPADWRSRIPEQLDALAEAWRDEAAWTGITQAGGFTFPGDVAGLVVLNELVVHGWDLSRATGQEYDCDSRLVEAAYGAMLATVARNPNGIPGVFGAPVSVADDAPLLDRLIGLSGRNPAWAPSAALE
jgi:uncharacterized protein (TIGR03086 family)